MAGNTKIIRTDNVTKKFDEKVAVQDVSFYVREGAIFGFIGPSGSGKTTIIKMLTGFYQPTSGEIRVFGKSPETFSRADREKIGYMPQLFGMYPNLTVWENLNFAASIYGLPLSRKNRLLEVLDFVELSQDRQELAQHLSGGMQQRLSLAATLVHDPHLIFLDEPTAGIDPVLRHKFWDHFRALQARGRTLFVTTQYVGEAAYCDIVGVMDEGRLIFVDTPANLRYRAFGGDLVDLRTVAPLNAESLQALQSLPFVLAEPQRTDDSCFRLLVKEAGTDIAELLDWAREKDCEIESIEHYSPPFDDVFVELVKAESQNA